MSPLTKPRPDAGVHLWLWRFISGTGPSLAQALIVGEALRGAATRHSCDLGFGLLPDEVHRDPDQSHDHAYWLPADADEDGFIDHAWVYCARAFPANLISALAQVSVLRVGRMEYELAPAWMGPLEEGLPFGPAKSWRAVTPYVTPKHRLTKTGKERPDCTPDALLREEIVNRGLPVPKSVTWEPSMWLGEDPVLASAFITTRQKGGAGRRPPADAVTSFPTIVFPEPVIGPLAFGFGAHFGLGMLMPLVR